MSPVQLNRDEYICFKTWLESMEGEAEGLGERQGDVW